MWVSKRYAPDILAISLWTVFIAAIIFMYINTCNHGPNYNPEDCLANSYDECEEWQECSKEIFKIVKVGHRNYLYNSYMLEGKNLYSFESWNQTLDFKTFENNRRKINCPKNLEE